MNKGTFLKYFLNQYTESGLAAVIQALAQAGLFIHKRLGEAGLADVLGSAGQTNIQGESVQKMDVIANNYVIDCLKNVPACGAMVSEETENVLPFNDMGKYVVAVDPLDGS
ncbi:MAG: hypothetical protein NZ522_01055, partial [Chitinophagales bacterium]|nr:hypothetical protein [Chitinophagales bacterium]